MAHTQHQFLTRNVSLALLCGVSLLGAASGSGCVDTDGDPTVEDDLGFEVGSEEQEVNRGCWNFRTTSPYRCNNVGCTAVARGTGDYSGCNLACNVWAAKFGADGDLLYADYDDRYPYDYSCVLTDYY